MSLRSSPPELQLQVVMELDFGGFSHLRVTCQYLHRLACRDQLQAALLDLENKLIDPSRHALSFATADELRAFCTFRAFSTSTFSRVIDCAVRSQC